MEAGSLIVDIAEQAARAELRQKIQQQLGSLPLEALERVSSLIDDALENRDLPEGVTSLDKWRRRDG